MSVFRLVNDTHTAPTKKFEDAVMGDSLADHGRRRTLVTRSFET
jgi:hypothetical protein